VTAEDDAGERRLEAQGYFGHEGLGTPGGDRPLTIFVRGGG
jgi:hypothetical protein